MPSDWNATAAFARLDVRGDARLLAAFQTVRRLGQCPLGQRRFGQCRARRFRVVSDPAEAGLDSPF